MIRTLLVDDDALTLELHRTYLGRLDGFAAAGECTGSRAALTALREGGADAFDLVLLDVTMPDGSGLEVLR
ncbi:response regulator, partial [Salmonella enterica]|uniref:response regulator n=1 Tax=Salmonella enterica TaxID=28901 RepID=UPI001092240B